jgi:micrococcal nuclease
VAPILPLRVVALAALVTVACAAESGPVRPPGTATVVHVVDGDTIVARISGVDEPIRMIGIDTPETVAPERPVECFGPEASARTTELLPPGTEVVLERDVEARDRYDRILAYVNRAADGLFVNLVLVEEGLAESKSYPPNTARDAQLAEAERRARGERRGMWGACS